MLRGMVLALALASPAMAEDVVDDWPCTRAVELLRSTQGAGLDGMTEERASQLTALLYYLNGVADTRHPMDPRDDRRDEAIRLLMVLCYIEPGLTVSDLTRTDAARRME